jgi:hypothetical protein
MNANDNRPSSEFGGRVVLNEAVSIARSELEASAELAPFVVTKGWGDCEVERFSEGLGQARARFDELLNGASSIGHCALAHLADAADGPTEIVIEVGRVGGRNVETFSQRFRRKRGLFRRFKLIGAPSRASEVGVDLAGA